MEAPDKIYVNFPFGEKHPWRGPMVTKQGLNRHDTIYIRKDALLEWLNGKMTVEEATEGIVGGYDLALKDVIKHIESL